MEQITLTKQEFAEIVQQEISKRLDGKKPISSGSIFNKVRIRHSDFDEINKKYDFTQDLIEAKNFGLGHPLSLKKYQHGLGCHEHYKVYPSEIHDHIRKLTLSAFGVTLNSDLSEKEYEEAARIYELIKGFYLYQYQKRIEKLTIDDFE
ncbi:hypothetical protein EKQ61_06355 [Staphylococcus gallinarum]|uniref:Phage protein n=1 Tax=Staphylococcus gallinarum TaxID=1293 RepID=A0A0D0QTL0_STAGA|nr:hypothetical protein [Staphylococcus gallinarum]KIR10406.1 hypothetical protein SH09_13170 [Staphylococcus gallinarum]RTX78577.1 hypothetical protein EKQ61_06355 [Staphylococcus gallinarum]GEQ07098.1 hypothetical protein SGA02_29260 [Staphylococcus gallinarum]SUM34082.1 phage protein [Staphylococcus gallinarum]